MAAVPAPRGQEGEELAIGSSRRGIRAVVRRNATIDWDKKEQVRASLRRHIRRLLTKYRYPPDKQEAAVGLVLEQAERLAAELAA